MYLIICVCVAFFFSWLGDTLCVLRQLIVGVAIKLSFFRKRLFVNRSWLKLDFFFSLFFGLDVANVSIVVLVVSSFYHYLTFFFLQTNFAPPPPHAAASQQPTRPFVPANVPMLRNAEQYQQPTLGSQLYPVCIFSVDYNLVLTGIFLRMH
jgi:hypothetical protein